MIKTQTCGKSVRSIKLQTRFVLRRLIAIASLALLAACEHPLEIVGQGDILSASGTRNCSAEQRACSNLVIGAYSESYIALPRDGWRFSGWQGCGGESGTCEVNVAADIVNQHWGTTVAPLVALFEPLDQIEVTAGPSQTVVEGSAVYLSGSVSYAGQSTASLSYQWQQLSGPSVSIQQADELVAHFNAPAVNENQVLGFLLSVSGPGIAPTYGLVAVTVQPALAGSTVRDAFNINSLDLYTIEQVSGNALTAEVDWLSDWKLLRIRTGDDTGVVIKRFVPASDTGVFQLDVLPTNSYPVGGRIVLQLMQDAYNYYEIQNSDKYGPGSLKKYVAGQLVDSTPLPLEYFQGAEFDINMYFSPSLFTVTGMMRAVHLNSNTSPISVNTINIVFHQQDAYIDDFYFSSADIPYIVAVGDSITWGEGDESLLDGIGFVPMLEQNLLTSTWINHLVFNESIPGRRASHGVALIPEIMQRHPAADTILLQYGSNDALYSVPSGLGLSSGDPGYSGSYKDSMQSIISYIQFFGKQLFVAKAPAMSAQWTSYNPVLFEYSQVIDELLAENNINGSHPDFYCYFSLYPEQLPDSIHPNAQGHSAMAAIWRNILLGQSSTCLP